MFGLDPGVSIKVLVVPRSRVGPLFRTSGGRLEQVRSKNVLRAAGHRKLLKR